MIWMDGSIDGWMDGWTDGWMDGWMDRRMDGWMDGGLDRWIDAWMTGCLDRYVIGQFHAETEGQKEKDTEVYGCQATPAVNHICSVKCLHTFCF